MINRLINFRRFLFSPTNFEQDMEIYIQRTSCQFLVICGHSQKYNNQLYDTTPLLLNCQDMINLNVQKLKDLYIKENIIHLLPELYTVVSTP